MASPVFHPFSRLPYELRLQIWEAACLPSSKHHRGLHYMDVEVDKHSNRGRVILSRCDWAIPLEKQGSISRSSRSAYLWDGGLWRACRESREAIIRHSHIKDWFRIQQICGNGSKHLSEQNGDWVGGEEAVPPGVLTLREGDKQLHLTIYPERDIFCISESAWASLSCKLSGMAMRFPFVGYDGNMNFLLGQNLALEFDPSWNLNWNSSRHIIWYLQEERSPRGFLTNMLIKAAHDMGFDSVDILWLIDKGVRWVARPGQDLSTVYHDCDAEYVEIGWEDTRSDTGKYGSRGAVTEFIEKLGSLSRAIERSEYHPMGPHCPDSCSCPDCGQFKVEKSVRLLVRRDNKVEEFTDEDDISID